jgi:hypothetical protein
MKRFILLLNHDDISLSGYLQHCMDRGEQFVKASSNIFTFTKKPKSNERIAAVTYVSEDPDLKMKFQMEDYSALMKKKGWKVLHIGSPEDIFDSKRHVFLQTEDPDIPFPKTDPETAKKANKRERRSLVRCFVMLLLLLGFGILFLSHDPDVFLSSNHILFPCGAAIIFWFISLIYAIRGTVTVSQKKQCANGFRNFLLVDKAVLFCMLAVTGLVISMIIDLFQYPDTGRLIVNDEQRFTVYADQVPLKLEDLEIPAVGKFRSSRLTKRSGLVMTSLVGSDQSFSDPTGVEDLSLLSYAVYQSEWAAGLGWVKERKGLQKLPFSDELATKWHADEVHTDGSHRMAVSYPGKLLILSVSTAIEDADPEIVLGKLLPEILQNNGNS